MNPLKATFELNKKGFRPFLLFNLQFIGICTLTGAFITYFVCKERFSITDTSALFFSRSDNYRFLKNWLTVLINSFPVFYGLFAVYLKEVIKKEPWTPSIHDFISSLNKKILVFTSVIFIIYFIFSLTLEYLWHYHSYQDSTSYIYFLSICREDGEWYLPYLGAFLITLYATKGEQKFNLFYSFIKPAFIVLFVCICLSLFTSNLEESILHGIFGIWQGNYDDLIYRILADLVFSLFINFLFLLTYSGIILFSTDKNSAEVFSKHPS